MIDLHCHLDGSITSGIARKLALLQNIDVSSYSAEEFAKMISVSDDCCDLSGFLSCFDFPLSLLQTKEAVSEAVYLIQEEMKAQGLVYLELRFAPQLHCSKGLTQEEIDSIPRENLKAYYETYEYHIIRMKG